MEMGDGDGDGDVDGDGDERWRWEMEMGDGRWGWETGMEGYGMRYLSLQRNTSAWVPASVRLCYISRRLHRLVSGGMRLVH